MTKDFFYYMPWGCILIAAAALLRVMWITICMDRDIPSNYELYQDRMMRAWQFALGAMLSVLVSLALFVISEHFYA